ncbi:MAG: M48 family metallopeptidase [Synergistaceae bacterium]|jgi:predicted metal-dependent hydrolase|nr:M48 family metallopeptidase [Synergistaceae bacterium]
MRTYLDGESFPYRGAPLRLKASPGGGRAAAEVSGDGLFLLVSASSAEERKKSILFFYTARTEEFIRSTLPIWTKKLGVRPVCAGVKYAKTRWGSCSSAGKLFFNSRMSMLSGDVAEYIVVHELCHLKQMNHSNAFWDNVRAALPGCMALRRRLRAEEKEAGL